ncbi:MAG TPA: DUF4252 domain-containing protein [Steroidobacteraceae bacterium]|nr:DUF4252 domain-containing protein [Steroidobacteraceae bacterium]
MNVRISLRVFAFATALWLAAPSSALAQAQPKPQPRPVPLRGQLLLPEFASLADKASEVVNVTLDSQLLGLGCRFLSTEDPEEAQVKKVCTSLRGIYVRHFTFDQEFAYPKADIDTVRRQLSAPGWSQMVNVRSNKEKANVDVYVLIDGDKAQGLSIIASEPREFTIVNVVGTIDLEQLHDLTRFGVPDLEIEADKKSFTKLPPKRN